jgi:cell division protease FtsH
LRAWSRERARPASKSPFLQRAESLNEDEKRNIAIHEAGHVMMMKHCFDKTPAYISLDGYRNFSLFIPTDEGMRTTFTKGDIEKEISVIMGGMVAEGELRGKGAKTLGASYDLMQATNIARKMVVEYGFGEKMSNKSLIGLGDFALTSGAEVLDDIQRILDDAREKTARILSGEKELMERLVDEITSKGLMNGDELGDFFQKNSRVAQ